MPSWLNFICLTSKATFLHEAGEPLSMQYHNTTSTTAFLAASPLTRSSVLFNLHEGEETPRSLTIGWKVSELTAGIFRD